jgi:hypothetical protein
VDWDQHVVRCPQGCPSAGWYPTHTPHGQPVVQVTFATADCTPCPVRSQCTRARGQPRGLTLPSRAEYEANAHSTPAPSDGGVRRPVRPSCRDRRHQLAGSPRLWSPPGALPWPTQDAPTAGRHSRGDQCWPPHQLADRSRTGPHPLLTVRCSGFRQTNCSPRQTLTWPTESC